MKITMMKTAEEIKKEISEIESDERLSYPPANVEVALLEVALNELKNPCAAEICVVDAPPPKLSNVVVALFGNKYPKLE